MLFGLYPCYVYMVRCGDGTYYTGVTSNLRQRIAQHNGEIDGGAKYTMRHRPVTLVYFEKLKSRSEAMKSEHEIKQLSHIEKAELINKADSEEGKIIVNKA